MQIYNQELSSIEYQQAFFEREMHKKNSYMSLDFEKVQPYNAYKDEKTAIAFVYFISGVFSAINSYKL